MYGDENQTKLPLPNTAGGWLQDVAVNTVHFMLRTGLTRPMFYCPSNSNHQKYNDYFWKFNNQTWDGSKFTNETGFIVAGYCYLLDLSPQNKRPDIVRYQTDTEKKVWLKSTLEPHPATREAVVDSIMGNAMAGTKYGYNFHDVPGGIYTQYGVYDSSSHLKNDYEPAGSNVGFMDAHVEWRNSSRMWTATAPRWPVTPWAEHFSGSRSFGGMRAGWWSLEAGADSSTERRRVTAGWVLACATAVR